MIAEIDFKIRKDVRVLYITKVDIFVLLRVLTRYMRA
jgi:hypothetical protein